MQQKQNRFKKKLLSSVFSCIVLFFILVAVGGCRSSKGEVINQPIKKSKPVKLERNQVRVKVDAHFFSDSPDIPISVYVFPPLRVDQNGTPVDEYQPIRDRKESLVGWKSLAPFSESIKGLTESFFEDRGFRVISFSDLLHAKKDHSFLVVMPYYSAAITPLGSSEDGNPLPLASFLFSLKGMTFPRDLDPASGREVFLQNIWVLCRRNDSFKTVLAITSRIAVFNIGKTKSYSDFTFIPEEEDGVMGSGH
jgi:hypothetical protein